MRGSRLNCWNTKPMRRCRMADSASSSRLDTSRPSSRYRPAVGVSRQPRMVMKVDFPDPDGPMTATISPARISTETPRSAWTVYSPRE
jgi:hypothetical protein